MNRIENCYKNFNNHHPILVRKTKEVVQKTAEIGKKIMNTRSVFLAVCLTGVVISAVSLAIPGVNVFGAGGIILFGSLLITGAYIDINKQRLKYEINLALDLIKNRINPEKRPWFSQVDDNLYLGSLPLQQHKAFLQTNNIKTVVSVVQEFENHTETLFSNPLTPEDLKKMGIDQHQFPSKDYRIVPIKTLHGAVLGIESKLKNKSNLYHVKKEYRTVPVKTVHQEVTAIEETQKKGKVLVHCKSGVGRSALVVACYLMKKNQWTPEETVDHLKQKRPFIKLGKKHIKQIEKYQRALERAAKT